MSASLDQDTTSVQEAAEETPLPFESRQSLEALAERPTTNGTSNHEEHHLPSDESSGQGQDGGPLPEGDAEEAYDAGDSSDRLSQLQSELDKVTNERDTFQSQYRGLLSKLTNMRATLGDKLRQDAVS